MAGKIIRSCETHRQADYISGSPQLAKEKGCKVLASKFDFAGATFPYEPVSDGEIWHFAKKGPRCGPERRVTRRCQPAISIDNNNIFSAAIPSLSALRSSDLGGRWAEWARELYLSLMLRLRICLIRSSAARSLIPPGTRPMARTVIMESLGHLRKHVVAFRLPQ